MENVRDRIILGATDMFLKLGIKAVTMDDVASNLGVSKRTIYENFGDKLQLLRECVQSRTCMRRAEMDKLAQLTTVDLLRAMLKGAGVNYKDHQREFRFFDEIKKYYPTLHKEMVEEELREGTEQTQLRIEQGKTEGIFLPGTNAEIAAYILVEQMERFTQTEKYNSFTQMVELMGHALVIFFRGISTLKGIAEIDAMLDEHMETEQYYRVK